MVMVITNKTNFAWSGNLWPQTGYNLRWPGSWSVNGQSFTGYDYVIVNLGPKASTKLRFTGDSSTRSGYLRVEPGSSSSSLDVAYAYFYEVRENGKLKDTTGSGESAWGDEFVLAVEKSPVIDTGIAWCPSSRYSDSSDQFQILLTIFDQNGTAVRSKTVTFTGHKAQFVSQLFPDLPQTFIGHMNVKSQQYFYLEALRMETTDSGFQLTSTPPDDYIP